MDTCPRRVQYGGVTTSIDTYPRADQAACFAQAMLAAIIMVAAAWLDLAQQARRMAVPTPASESAMRRNMGARGLGSLLATRPRMTAAQRRQAEVMAESRAGGWERGRFVGGGR
jgi:uncharacterized protein YfaQ (DUF2300 family)